MDVETILKIIGTLLGSFTIWKFLYEIKSWKKSHYRDEYTFSREFLNDVESTHVKLHPYSLEKGCQAIAGTEKVNADEVQYILSLKDPLQCLEDYILSQKLMEKIDTEGDLKVKFRKRYSYRFYRRLLKFQYTLFYFILSFLSLSPFIAQGRLGTSYSEMFIQLAFTLPFFGLYAWGSLNALRRITRGEHLVLNQTQHTKRVILES